MIEMNERIIMLLPITDTRPETLRVIRQDEFWMVEAQRPNRFTEHAWTVLAAHRNREAAIRDCENWYI